MTTPADWYPDPYGRHELRYWDGELWTDHVSSHGRQSIDPTETAPVKHVVSTEAPDRIQQQVHRHFDTSEKKGATVDRAAGTAGEALLDQQIFVVNQKVKLIEVNSEYAIFDRAGNQVGSVRQVGQSALKKAARFLGNFDKYMTHKLQIVDATGAVVLTLTRPAKFIKSRVIVGDGLGADVGEVVQQNVFGKIRFALMAGGHEIGTINAENWRAWNFNVQDANGIEVARITKTFEGVLKTMFTTADNYVVQLARPLEDPLRRMVVASALSVDTALKQDSRGFS